MQKPPRDSIKSPPRGNFVLCSSIDSRLRSLAPQQIKNKSDSWGNHGIVLVKVVAVFEAINHSAETRFKFTLWVFNAIQFSCLMSAISILVWPNLYSNLHRKHLFAMLHYLFRIEESWSWWDNLKDLHTPQLFVLLLVRVGGERKKLVDEKFQFRSCY